jgi:hypothetical protein
MFGPAHRPRVLPALILGAALVFAGVRGILWGDRDSAITHAAATPVPASPSHSGEHVILLNGGNAGRSTHP